mgnify:CR=1 FL=1
MKNLFAAIFCAFLAGCIADVKLPKGYSEEIQEGYFEDIPWPAEFDYVTEDSYTYVAPGDDGRTRSARLVFEGLWTVEETVNFFKKNLPANDFVVRKEPFVSKATDTVVLYYRKLTAPEYLDVRVERVEDRVRVVMDLGVYGGGGHR